MKQFEEHIQEITFEYSVMIRSGDNKNLWGIFSKPNNTGVLQWFHTKENGNWISMQTHIVGNWKKNSTDASTI